MNANLQSRLRFHALGTIAGILLAACFPALAAAGPLIDAWMEEISEQSAEEWAEVGRKYAKARRSKAEFERDLHQARRDFWRAYPDGRGIEKLQERYQELLFEKDVTFLLLSLPEGRRGRIAGITKLAGLEADGGIAPAADSAFSQWVTAMRRHLGAQKDFNFDNEGDLVFLTSDRFLSALKATQAHARPYTLLRTWAEFYNAGHEQDFYPTAKDYAMFLLRTQHAYFTSDDDPPSAEQVDSNYRDLTEACSERVVLNAAEKVRTASKNEKAFVEINEALNPRRARSPMWAILKLIAAEDDLGLIYVEFCYDNTNSVSKARKQLEDLIRNYGRETLIEIGRTVRTAPRRRGKGFNAHVEWVMIPEIARPPRATKDLDWPVRTAILKLLERRPKRKDASASSSSDTSRINTTDAHAGAERVAPAPKTASTPPASAGASRSVSGSEDHDESSEGAAAGNDADGGAGARLLFAGLFLVVVCGGLCARALFLARRSKADALSDHPEAA